jgi:Chaperone of endosialidase
MVRQFMTALTAVAALGVGATAARAQSLGTFSWQLTPYCNVITVTVTQNGSNYTLDGYDNQCGGSTRAAVLGMAVPNPTGTVTLGFAIVTPPSGAPVHVTTVIDLGSLGGSWSDDQGNSGTFVFTPAGVGSGAPRPAALNGVADNTVTSSKIVDGAVGGLDINETEVQKRVSSVCPSNQLMTAVNQDGTVVCQAVPSGAGGDITAVNAGSGLAGGGTTGDVVLTIGTGGVTTTHLANNAVNSAKVLDGSIGAADVDPTQVQTRVTGTCPAGQAMRTIAQTGAVTCEPIAGGAGGDITAVVAGLGLTGGATTGAAVLTVAFGGSGVLETVAHSDHTHAAVGTANTAVGGGAMATMSTGQGNTALGTDALGSSNNSFNTALGRYALEKHASGNENTAIGLGAMRDSATSAGNVAVGVRAIFNGGSENTAVGFETLENSPAGGTSDNTAVGYRALRAADGSSNTALGHSALTALNTGTLNVAVGKGAIDSLTSGDQNIGIGATTLGALTGGEGNIAIGYQAGVLLASGDDNVYLANAGLNGDNGTMRIGNANHTRAFVAGIRGVTTGNNNAVNVVIDSAGQLGTVSSSRKTKFDIADLSGSVSAAVQRLRPVQFRYKQTFSDGSTPIQYGLIAEEVEQVLPELVAYDEHGDPMTVKYHVLPSLLLAEVQRLSREVAALQSELSALAAARR